MCVCVCVGTRGSQSALRGTLDLWHEKQALFSKVIRPCVLFAFIYFIFF